MADSPSLIPTVDLSPFLNEGVDDGGQQKAKETITEACAEYGFFQIKNHGVPLELMAGALELSREFFGYPDEEKRRCSPNMGAPIPAGYSRQPDHSPDKNEYLMLFPPYTNLNVYPPNPPHFREVLDELFSSLVKTGQLVETILNECLGLPPNFLRDFNDDRSWDFLAALHYGPATEAENNGLSGHEDGNCVTLVFQDDAGGLEVQKDGKWIPVTPSKDTIVVNVLSNKKFKSATHRVVRPKGKGRHSYAFFYNLQGDKWVEPLPHFTTQVGEKPKYRGFFYKDYQALRLKNKTHPPERPEDVIHITHYAI